MNDQLLDKSRMRAEAWLRQSTDEATRNEVAALLEAGGDALVEAFHADLEFGTGGLRGIMGTGTNRMNAYTVGQATQGFANYLRKQFGKGWHKVAIAYDCRHNSRQFAEVTADVFAANGFEVLLTPDLRPTPLLSFIVRDAGCVGGVVLTASHNPPIYNGYKVYWNDGAQVTEPHDTGIIAEVRKVSSLSAVKRGGDTGRIALTDAATDAAYLSRVVANRLASDEIAQAAQMPIVYTALHGTGITLVPEALKQVGFANVQLVEDQAVPDGDFPTVKSPNPEEGEALEMGIALAQRIGAELVLGTDPDCDRVGIAVKNREGNYELLNGNDTGALLTWYQLEQMSARGTLPKNGYVGKTIVTTELLADIAAGYGLPCYDTLTGFKHIARLIAEKEPRERFITGGEESYGYMIGDFVRDKDGVAASAMICEVAAWGYNRGLTLPELLQQVHEQFGLYREALVSLTKHGISGAEEIRRAMEHFRQSPPAALGGLKVLAVRDYRSGERRVLADGSVAKIDLPSSNVLQFELEGNSLVTARPSGTEPKIKFYFSVCNGRGKENYVERRAEAEACIERLKQSMLDLLGG